MPGRSEQASSRSTSATTSRRQSVTLVRRLRVGSDHAGRPTPRQDRGPVLRPGRERRGCAGGAQRRRASLSSSCLKGTGRDRRLPIPPPPCSRTRCDATGASIATLSAYQTPTGVTVDSEVFPDHPAARRAGHQAPVHVRLGRPGSTLRGRRDHRVRVPELHDHLSACHLTACRSDPQAMRSCRGYARLLKPRDHGSPRHLRLLRSRARARHRS